MRGARRGASGLDAASHRPRPPVRRSRPRGRPPSAPCLRRPGSCSSRRRRAPARAPRRPRQERAGAPQGARTGATCAGAARASFPAPGPAPGRSQRCRPQSCVEPSAGPGDRLAAKPAHAHEPRDIARVLGLQIVEAPVRVLDRATQCERAQELGDVAIGRAKWRRPAQDPQKGGLGRVRRVLDRFRRRERGRENLGRVMVVEAHKRCAIAARGTPCQLRVPRQ